MGNTPGGDGRKSGDKDMDADSSPEARKTPTNKDDPDAKVEVVYKLDSSSLSSGKSGKVTLEDFELLSVIGRGSFGKVFQVRKKDTKKVYAMKALKKKALVARKQVSHTKTERKVLQSINHPFIVNLKYAFQTDAKLYMVMEFFNGGELFFHLKNEGRFEESRACFYAAQIVCALEYLHQKNIVYRDLKPENILLDDLGYVKLTDFGLSKEVENKDALTHTFCGTPEYLAPEVLHGNGYGLPVDWWSLGALLFEMLTGLPPYYDENTNVMYEKILNQEVHYPNHISAKAKAIMTKLLDKNWETRLGTKKDAAEVKKDPFFAGIDWDLLYKKQVTPPFKPKVASPVDLSNIDDEFKSETPKDTPVQASKLAQKAQFSNFTYDGQEMHAEGADFAPGLRQIDESSLDEIAE